MIPCPKLELFLIISHEVFTESQLWMTIREFNPFYFLRWNTRGDERSSLLCFITTFFPPFPPFHPNLFRNNDMVLRKVSFKLKSLIDSLECPSQPLNSVSPPGFLFLSLHERVLFVHQVWLHLDRLLL